MATLDGKKHEKSLGNLRLATDAERKTIQIIYDLKNKTKMISDEISKRSAELPHDLALSSCIRFEEGEKWITTISGRPQWLHIPVKEFDLTKYPMTKADKLDFNVNS